MTHTLCIDIGNTCIHYGVINEDKALYDTRIAIPSNDSSTTEYEHILNDIKSQGISFDNISYCSVIPHYSSSLNNFLDNKKLSTNQLTPKDAYLWDITLANNQKLGADCLANLIAVKTLYKFPAIIIDAGTAVTVDMLDKSGNFTGSIIAPGLRLYTAFLHEKTALLPEISLNTAESLPHKGQSIIESMKIGCQIGYQGMIKAILDQALLSFPNKASVNIYATGGHMDFLRKLPFNITFDPHLTLKGLQKAQKSDLM